ncbi:MAG: hypothetical protein WAZ94_05140, partial [Phycisphaerales bacterium]
HPFIWSPSGKASAMDIGDESTRFFQMRGLHAHADGHMCSGIERLDGLVDTIGFWRSDGGFVPPDVFEQGDAGMQLLSRLHPVGCWPVGPDWYLVQHYLEPDHLLSLAFVRVRLDCIP